MANWSDESAIAALSELIEESRTLEAVRRYAEEHISWVTRTTGILGEIFGESSRYFQTFVSFTWNEQSSFIVRGFDPGPQIESGHQRAYVRQLGSARGLLSGAIDEIKRNGVASVYKDRKSSKETGDVLKVVSIVEQKLRKVIRTAPKDEKEVQIAIDNLLIGADIEHSREAVHIEYATKTYIPDFTFDHLDLALEVKFSNDPNHEKKFIAEINDDILAYHTKYQNLLFVVYDMGHIRDVDRFANEFQKHDSVMVRIVKH